MPLAAHAVWQGDALRLDAMLGHPLDPGRPVLRTRLIAPAGDDAAAVALGERAAAALRDADAGGYLAAASAA
jgi:hydroxymethylbilane synthase